MAKTEHHRFIDLHREDVRKRDDFNPRTRPVIEIMSGLFMLLALLAIIAGFSRFHEPQTGSLICLGVTALALAVALIIRDLRHQVESAEFLNAIFASALASDASFSIITKLNGEIVYADRGFQQLFQDFHSWPERNLDCVLTRLGMNEAQREELRKMVSEGVSGSLNASGASHGEGLPDRLVVEPSTRPKGYSLVRGRST